MFVMTALPALSPDFATHHPFFPMSFFISNLCFLVSSYPMFLPGHSGMVGAGFRYSLAFSHYKRSPSQYPV